MALAGVTPRLGAFKETLAGSKVAGAQPLFKGALRGRGLAEASMARCGKSASTKGARVSSEDGRLARGEGPAAQALRDRLVCASGVAAGRN
jgi:hypothetical protein